MPVVLSAVVPPGDVCCWPTEATSAELDVPRGTQSTEARRESEIERARECGGRGGGPHSAGAYPTAVCVCVCVGACVFAVVCAWPLSKRTRGTKPSLSAITHCSQKAARKEKRGMWEPVSIISLPFKVKVKDIGSNDRIKWCR